MKKIILTSMILLLTQVFAYEFEYQGHKLDYDVDTLKFYENNELLSVEEVKNIFSDYEVILVSQFGENKKLRIKNSFFKSKKVLLLNDTQRTFHLYYIYPTASRYEKPEIKSLITVHGKKNVRLKHSGGSEFEITIR